MTYQILSPKGEIKLVDFLRKHALQPVAYSDWVGHAEALAIGSLSSVEITLEPFESNNGQTETLILDRSLFKALRSK